MTKAGASSSALASSASAPVRQPWNAVSARSYAASAPGVAPVMLLPRWSTRLTATLLRRDIEVHAEEVVRVVLPLGRLEPRVIRAVAALDARRLVFRQEVHVAARSGVRCGFLEHAACPV